MVGIETIGSGRIGAGVVTMGTDATEPPTTRAGTVRVRAPQEPVRTAASPAFSRTSMIKLYRYFTATHRVA